MNLERIILEALNRQKPRLMSTQTLWSEVRIDDDSASHTAFKQALRTLEEKGQVVVIPGEDRDKAKITQAGEARLAE